MMLISQIQLAQDYNHIKAPIQAMLSSMYTLVADAWQDDIV